jgi:hypothetical protein
MRRPTKLAFKFLHELLDRRGSRHSFFKLDSRQSGLVFLVREIYLKATASQQRPAYQGYEKDDVLPE